MIRLSRIFSNKIFLLFIFVHIALFTINFAEWGDSYRILRASEYIREFSYPDDEKRAPLFSTVLAMRPEFIDQVQWARFEMFLISVASFIVFYKLLELYKAKERQRDLALLLFTFNPVYLYWSLRVMADVPFTLLVLLAFYLLKKWEKQKMTEMTNMQAFQIGLIVGLSVLTRFEGYILGFTVGLALLLNNFDKKKLNEILLRIVSFGIGSVLVMLPWLLYRNPFTSAYFEEPGGRVYDLKMLLVYISSSLFLFGFTSAKFFLKLDKEKAKAFVLKNVGLTAFVLIELFLALIWPAAIPRLFTPVIPFLIILLSFGIERFFSEKKRMGFFAMKGPATLLLVYVLAQYLFKLQFLVLDKYVLAVIVFLQVIMFFGIFFKKYQIFYQSLFLTLILWSVATVFLHKDIFRAVVVANKYVVSNLSGKIGYNDVSSVSDWYLNQKDQNDAVEGVYVPMDNKAGRSYDTLLNADVDYVMITNEHNTDLEFRAEEIPYLDEVKEFRYTIRGKSFFTKIVKFNK